MTRRDLVRRGAAVAAMSAAWPLLRVEPGSAAATIEPPPGFPGSIRIYQQAFVNWAQEIEVEGLWTCAPRDGQEVVRIVNWAARHGYRVRPRGKMHGWSPLSVGRGSRASERVIMVDTTEHLTHLSLRSKRPGVIRAGAGALIGDLLGFAERHGLGVTATPAPGDITVGGALAIDGHGTAVPAEGERRRSGQTYGSLSNLVVAVRAVVWSRRRSRYVLRRFHRSEREIDVLLTHLGRSFVTEVELRLGRNSNLRCVSLTDIPTSELFADPGAAGPDTRTFAGFLDRAGRAEAIWYPFTDRPWLKVWSVESDRPAASRTVSSPYNYAFSDHIPLPFADAVRDSVLADPSSTPGFGRTQLAATAAGLGAEGSADIWGPSKDLLLYIRPTTIRFSANGYAVICRRRHVQRAISEFTHHFQQRLAAYQAAGSYPMNGPVEIRVTGLDRRRDVGIEGARPPLLSALRPDRRHPERDVAVWFDILTFPGTPDSLRFYREIERWMYGNYRGYALVRPEWSKGWAYGNGNGGAWTDDRILKHRIPGAFRDGRKGGSWKDAVAALDRLDPHRVFTSPLLNRLMPRACDQRRRRRRG